MERNIVLMAAMPGLKQNIALNTLERIGYRVIKNCSAIEAVSQLTHPSENKAPDHSVISLTLNKELFDIREKLVKQKGSFSEIKKSLTLLCLIEDPYYLIVEQFNEEKEFQLLREQFDLLQSLRQYASVVIDTTALLPDIFEKMLECYFDINDEKTPLVRLVSFSYRLGIPREANLVFDARLLSNPYYDSKCKALTGKDKVVKEFIEQDPSWPSYSADLQSLIKLTLSNYQKANLGKFITIACGCTGGQHRSVFVVEYLADFLKELKMSTLVEHRDMPAIS